MSLQGPMRVSDADRERAVTLLREHHAAGRLDSTELDERCAQAFAARTDQDLWHALRELPAPAPPPRPDTSQATASLVTGIVALVLLLLSIGTLSFVTVPMSVTAWVMGRSAQQRGLGGGGLWTGIVGTVVGGIALAGWAALFLL